MRKLKKSLFFGYSRSSVHAVINEFKSQVRELEIRNSQLLQTIEDLKNKEQFISEAIVEAKRVSIGIVSEAEVHSEQLVNEVNNRIEKSEEELEHLEATKQDIMNRTEYIKHELKQLLENQINMIDNIDTGGVHHVGHIIDDLLTMSHERIDGVGRILTNEDPIPVNTLQNEKSKVAYLTPDTNVAIDMKEPPVFTMDSF